MFYSESLRNVVVILFKCKLLNIKQIPVFLQKAGMEALRFELRYRRDSHWAPIAQCPEHRWMVQAALAVPLLVWCHYINQFYMTKENSPATIS